MKTCPAYCNVPQCASVQTSLGALSASPKLSSAQYSSSGLNRDHVMNGRRHKLGNQELFSCDRLDKHVPLTNRYAE